MSNSYPPPGVPDLDALLNHKPEEINLTKNQIENAGILAKLDAKVPDKTLEQYNQSLQAKNSLNTMLEKMADHLMQKDSAVEPININYESMAIYTQVYAINHNRPWQSREVDLLISLYNVGCRDAKRYARDLQRTPAECIFQLRVIRYRITFTDADAYALFHSCFH